MRPNHLLRKRPSSPFPSATTNSTLPWISPLHLRNPTTPAPDPPPPPPPTTRPLRRYILHLDAIRMIKLEPDPQRALDIFNRATDQPGFNHNHSTYSAIIHKLAASKKFLAVDALLRCMSHEPCRFQEGILLNLMSHYSRFSLLEKTLSMFYLISPLVRSRPSPKALTTCLNLLVESGRFDLAQRLLSDAREQFQLEPNTCVYNILVKHHCRMSKDLDSAFGVLEEMRRSDSAPPNLITYSTLMGALCDEGRIKDAFQLFEEMIERYKIVPDPLTYNVLINGFCKNGMADKARQVMGFMRTNGCEPNVVNYSTLMNGYCKEGRLEEAREVFDEMRKTNLKADTVSYTTLISCLCRTGRTDEGMELVKEMVEKGCRPDVLTANSIIGGLCNEKRFGEAMALLEKVPYEGVRLNKGSYRIVMNRLCSEGEMEKAAGLLGLMLERGIVPHFATSNSLLIGLCEYGKVEDAIMALFGLMETGFLPEIDTWIQLVGSVCRERKLIRAFQLIDELTFEEISQEEFL